MLSLSLLKCAFRRATVIVAFALGATGPASATYVVGQWDPAFGTPFTNLGWRGSMTADIADDCLDNAAGVYVNVRFLRGCSTPWTVVSATVELYDINAPGIPTIEVLDFTGSSFLITMALDGAGEVLGWTSWVTSERRSGVTWPIDTDGDGIADSSVVNPYFALGMTYDRTTGVSQARLGWSRDDPSCLSLPKNFDIPACFDGFNDARNFPAEVAFSIVPEPVTLALVGAALGLAGVTTRRRRA